MDPGEQCDDGCLLGVPNVCETIDNGDGCTQYCQNEAVACGNSVCEIGEFCDQCPECGTCPLTCGDGEVDVLLRETCDWNSQAEPSDDVFPGDSTQLSCDAYNSGSSGKFLYCYGACNVIDTTECFV